MPQGWDFCGFWGVFSSRCVVLRYRDFGITLILPTLERPSEVFALGTQR